MKCEAIDRTVITFPVHVLSHILRILFRLRPPLLRLEILASNSYLGVLLPLRLDQLIESPGGEVVGFKFVVELVAIQALVVGENVNRRIGRYGDWKETS